jgi:hypothetical protein
LVANTNLPVGSPRELPAEPDPCRFGLRGDFDTALAVIAPVFTWVRLAQRIPVRIHIVIMKVLRVRLLIPGLRRFAAKRACPHHLDRSLRS